jgi:hypothetical protein
LPGCQKNKIGLENSFSVSPAIPFFDPVDRLAEAARSIENAPQLPQGGTPQ